MSVKDGKTVLIVMKPFKMIFGVMVRVMVFNATFNNISVISWWCFTGGGNQSTRRKPPIYHKSLTNFIT